MSQPPHQYPPPPQGGGPPSFAMAPPPQQQQQAPQQPGGYPPQQQQQQPQGYAPRPELQQQHSYPGSDAGSVSSSSGPPSTTGSAAAAVPTEQPKKFAMEDHVLVAQGPDEETEDGVIRNRDAIRKIRDTWIYKQVRLRQDEFTHYRTVRTTVDWRVVVCWGKGCPCWLHYAFCFFNE